MSNAENNEHLAADELYVAECWADEGPTLKRWRPRARGRATRINKRTCHITVVVAQLSEEELETRAARLAATGRRSADADRAARVAASKESEEDTTVDTEVAEDTTVDAEAAEAEAVTEQNEISDQHNESDESATSDDAEPETSDETTAIDEQDEKEA